jgi:D-lactate dehydrogenase (cytochrome)
VGQGKMKYLIAEHGRVAIEAMRALKAALDPHGILNPGKIVADV